jgi:hypothetical protein
VPVILRILGFAGKFLVRNWKTIAITLGLVAATGFVFREAASQAVSTLERFIWLGIIVLALLAVTQFLKLRTEAEKRSNKK